MTGILNRRRHPRFAVGIDCKLIRAATSRYDIARTGDVSAGGAMLEVRTSRAFHAGEPIDIAVNWAGRPMLTSEELITARVLRADPLLGHTQRVAICFDRVQDQADALAAAAAA
ncbi:MAG: PilZ domain-containing protein [Phycisphaeraceae bacterium]|nr:MAG: PilZ domain-containing protein [Phycisphaeraceae bacterium]